MTESEWLTSEYPVVMLTFLMNGPESPAGYLDKNWQQPSDRKLRLFADACRRSFYYGDSISAVLRTGLSMGPNDYTRSKSMDELIPAVEAAQTWSYEMAITEKPKRAEFLRDIFGNPFWPVKLPPNPNCLACNGQGRFLLGSGEDAEPIPCRCCPWLTPDVLSLAQTAYDVQDRKCLACNRWTDCKLCKNTRRLPTHDGILDPVRLMILADALEEAGCPGEEWLEIECDACQGRGKVAAPAGDFARHWPCDLCDMRGTLRWLGPHPLLAHLRSPGPHVRGCWALDSILDQV